MGERQAWYTFGVMPLGVPLPDGLDPNPLAATVEAFDTDAVRAIVSRIGRDELTGHDPQDPDWLLGRVRAHDRVLSAIAAAHAVVPFRFGLVHSSRAAMARTLADRSEALAATLGRIGRAQEWTITIGADAPERRRTDGPPPPGSQGQNYLLGRGAELTARDSVRDAAAALCSRCRSWHIPIAPLPAGPDGAARMACLIQRLSASHILRSFAALVGGRQGVRLTAYGPLPPYHFVDQP